MTIECVWEHNGGDTLLHAGNVIGVFTRGSSKEEALGKMPREIGSYFRWRGKEPPSELDIIITEEKASDLNIADADSDVIFTSERKGLTLEEYEYLKALTLKSAADFHRLYSAFPDKDRTSLPPRKTFYGDTPRTAREMYLHTKNVNAYYFTEICVDADNEGAIEDCRARGFSLLETQPDFLAKPAAVGSYGEEWSLRKLFRRFIWHDRIHAKAMHRMGKAVFGEDAIPDVFYFG